MTRGFPPAAGPAGLWVVGQALPLETHAGAAGAGPGCFHLSRSLIFHLPAGEAAGRGQDGRKLVSLKAILLTNPEEKFHFKKNGLEK